MIFWYLEWPSKLSCVDYPPTVLPDTNGKAGLLPEDAFGVTEDRGMCDESVGVCPTTRQTPTFRLLITQYFDLRAYVSPMVNSNEFRLVGGNEAGGPFR